MKMIEKIRSVLATVIEPITIGLELSKREYTIDTVLRRMDAWADPFFIRPATDDPFLTRKSVTDWFTTNGKARAWHVYILDEIRKW